ncbi:MAG: SDR family NAD(P)-dependent oxidoreductase [Myxococcota bacterium]
MKTIVVTGGTGGIGLHTAIGVARSGARVVVTGRDATRGEEAVLRIRQESGSQHVELALGDLSDASGVEALAATLNERLDRIDVLVNNAGFLAQERTENADGVEIDFAVNVLAPWRLTHGVLPLLRAAAPSRVLLITGGNPSGKFDGSDLQARDGFVALTTYDRSKRAAEAMALVLAERVADKGVHVNVVYPGGAATAMTRAMTMKSLPWYMKPAWPLFQFFMSRATPEKASRSSVYAATTPDLEGVHGAYIDTNSKRAELHRTVHDPANQARVLAEMGVD